MLVISCIALQLATGKANHLLCRLYPVTLHVEHLKALEQDVLRGGGHCRCEGGLQGPRRQAAQVLDGQLGRADKAGRTVWQHINLQALT